MNLETVGAGLGAILMGFFGWLAGRGGREVQGARQEAEVDVVELLREEVERLASRVKLLEASESRSRARIYQLERMLVQMGVELPPSPDTAAVEPA